MTQGLSQAGQVMLGTQFTKTITIESVHDATLRGEVTFRLLSLQELMQAGVKQVQYRGGLSPDLLDFWTNQMARMTAELELAVTAAPPGWYREEVKNGAAQLVPAPSAIKDIQVLITIWEAYVAFRDTFPTGGAAPGAGGTTAQP